MMINVLVHFRLLCDLGWPQTLIICAAQDDVRGCSGGLLNVHLPGRPNELSLLQITAWQWLEGPPRSFQPQKAPVGSRSISVNRSSTDGEGGSGS